jgi:hypothetical protein
MTAASAAATSVIITMNEPTVTTRVNANTLEPAPHLIRDEPKGNDRHRHTE